MIRIEKVISKSVYVLIWLRNDSCHSVNYCANHSCELSSEDLFSKKMRKIALTTVVHCTYIKMKRNRKPECKERNNKSDIMDYNELSYCKTYKKHVDREWGSWVEITEEETLTEWYQIAKRFIFLLEKKEKKRIKVLCCVWNLFFRRKTGLKPETIVLI